MREVTLSTADVERVVLYARERQARREAAGDENFGTPDAGAEDHALGLAGELAVVRVYFPDREEEWWSLAQGDMDTDEDVFGLLVRTRDRHNYGGWINERDAEKQKHSHHALVTAERVKDTILDAAAPISLRVWGTIYGEHVISGAVPFVERRDASGYPGVFPNRACWEIPFACYSLEETAA